VGKRLYLCVAAEAQDEKASITANHNLRATILVHSALLVYLTGLPQLLIWHDDDVPLNICFASAPDIIASRVRKFQELHFI
jgi:hypothetical protein